MKNYTIIAILLSLTLSVETYALPDNIGSSFNYQGELIDNGVPANGVYDIKIDAHNASTGDTVIESQEFSDIMVNNGLINIPNVDFGDEIYNGFEVWLAISVKPAGENDYTLLTPRQRIDAVPYAVQADFLGPLGADNGDILRFNGQIWEPSVPDSNTQWSESGSTLTNLGKVGIGESTPSAQLHVTNNDSQISLLKVDDVGDTRFVVQASGRVGVGPTNPAARFHIDSETDEDPLRVQINNATKLRVHSNGGTTLGSNPDISLVPDNGLHVRGNVKQSEESSGMLKYMLVAQCDPFPTIEREYNGTSAVGSATIERDGVGRCSVELPFNTSSSFIIAQPLNDIVGTNKTANCISSALSISCKFEESSTGTDTDVFFTLLVY